MKWAFQQKVVALKNLQKGTGNERADHYREPVSRFFPRLCPARTAYQNFHHDELESTAAVR
jgi:hypothetical protein